MRILTALCALALSTMALGCGDDDASTSGAGGGGAGQGGSGGQATLPTTFGTDERPVELKVPEGYDASTAAPLIILLHGYSASGFLQDVYFGLTDVANERGILYAHPDGTIDPSDKRFWNATDACCNFEPSDVDDSAYLRQLVDDISASYNVDPKRVYFMGHSNGGFMSYRMACDHADTVAAIISLAGASFADGTSCNPSEPVHVLQLHGTMDETIAYEGGTIGANAYPSAADSVAYWAGVAGCDATPAQGTALDVESSIDGTETAVSSYTAGCAGGSAELWTLEGASHIPNLQPDIGDTLVDYLLSHPKE